MRDSTSNGPVRSIWSTPSNSSEPICKWVSCGIMGISVGLGMDKANLVGQALAEMPKTPRSPPNLVAPFRRASSRCWPIPAVQLLDVTGPLQVFATANDHRAAGGRRAALCAPRGGERRPGRRRLRPGSRSRPGRCRRRVRLWTRCWSRAARVSRRRPPIPSWSIGCGERATQARRVASVCTGAFLLAASGVLDGRRAATHWSVCAELARRYPAVRVEPDPIFVRDGAVWTSAGVTAGIDLALALVEQDLGRTVALAVARYLVVFLKRPGGQAQFSAALSLQSAEDEFGALHDWIGKHLADDMSLPVLAEPGRHERAQFQPPLCRGDRADAGPRGRAAAGRGGAAAAVGVAPAGESGSRSAAASARRKPCVAAFCACCRPRRRITAPASVPEGQAVIWCVFIVPAANSVPFWASVPAPHRIETAANSFLGFRVP